jgi:hypothetical protein
MNNSQVAHVWANQSKERANGSNLYCYGSALQSYGTTIGYIDVKKKVAFLSSNNFSSSTSKHLSYARYAIDGNVTHILYTPAFMRGYTSIPTVKEMIAASAIELLKRFKALPGKRSSHWLSNYNADRDNLLTVSLIYKVKISLPEADGDLKAKVALIAEREDHKRKLNEAKARKAAKIAKIAAQEDFNAWINGNPVHFPREFNPSDGESQYLTLRGDTVYTSLGAEVPLFHVKRALVKYHTKARPWVRNGDNIHVGHFQIDRIDENGNVKAGCHYFTASEIQRFAEKWGL